MNWAKIAGGGGYGKVAHEGGGGVRLKKGLHIWKHFMSQPSPNWRATPGP